MSNFSMVLACDSKWWIWKDNQLPWDLKKDMKYFQRLTLTTENPDFCNVVIMWRKTWESIPEKYRPLPGRINCVLSSDSSYSAPWAQTFTSFDWCISKVSELAKIENIFVIWGTYLYNSLLVDENLEKIYLTAVDWDFSCDVFFEGIPNNFRLKSTSSTQKERDIEYYFQIFIRDN